MARKVNKTAIGVFVVGAAVLLIISILIFGSGSLFKHTEKYVLYFDGTVKGLSVGAPVIFKGVQIGTITNISLIYDPEENKVLIPVIIDVELAQVKDAPKNQGYSDYALLVKKGLRARLEIQNFISGELMLSLDFYHDQPAKIYNIIKTYPELPALPIPPDIMQIMDEIPIKKITTDLDQAVLGINRLVNSQGISELDQTLGQVTELARSSRIFIEYLDQHPESFLKGKPIPGGQ